MMPLRPVAGARQCSAWAGAAEHEELWAGCGRRGTAGGLDSAVRPECGLVHWDHRRSCRSRDDPDCYHVLAGWSKHVSSTSFIMQRAVCSSTISRVLTAACLLLVCAQLLGVAPHLVELDVTGCDLVDDSLCPGGLGFLTQTMRVGVLIKLCNVLAWV